MNRVLITVMLALATTQTGSAKEPNRTAGRVYLNPSGGLRYDATWSREAQKDARIVWTVRYLQFNYSVTFTVKAGQTAEAVASAMAAAWLADQAQSPVHASLSGSTVSFVGPAGVPLNMEVREENGGPPCNFQECSCILAMTQLEVALWTTVGVQWEGTAVEDEDDIQWTVAYVNGGFTNSPSVEFDVEGGDTAEKVAERLKEKWRLHKDRSVKVCVNGAFMLFSAPGTIQEFTVDGEISSVCTVRDEYRCVLTKSEVRVYQAIGVCPRPVEAAYETPGLPAGGR